MRSCMRPHAQHMSQQTVLQCSHRPSHCSATPARLMHAVPQCGIMGGQMQRRSLCSTPRQQPRRQLSPSASATATEELQAAPVAADVKGLGFYTGDDGYVYCDNVRVDDVRQQVSDSPFYLYSKDRITANYQAYAKVRTFLA